MAVKKKKQKRVVKTKKKIALITGVTGQDGSYLAEFLLDKKYEVHGIIRRASTFNTHRIEHIYQDPHEDRRLHLHYGDLADGNIIRKLLYKIHPDEIYNLGAQSHVRVSFDIPEYTANIAGMGTLRLLEAIKDYTGEIGHPVKFYQASSSEMFGAAPGPQNENTPFYPRSPYGVAKVFAYYTVKNYREAYGMFAVNGILFNHETIAAFMPMFCKQKESKSFDIKPICEIVSFDEGKKEYQAKEIDGLQVWGKEGWVDVSYASAYPHDAKNENKRPKFVNSRNGIFMATSSHVAFLENGKEKKVEDIEIGDRLEEIDLPEGVAGQFVSEEEAELIGLMVGDGSISYAKRGIGLHGKFTNSSSDIRAHFSELWKKVVGGSTKYYPSKSGFNPNKIVGQLMLAGGNDWLRCIDFYNKDRTKRVPKKILNASNEIKLAFLRGYNMADGLKANKCTYEFRNFRTNSATLAMGLWYLIDVATQQDINVSLETRSDGRVFYSLNILSPVDNSKKELVARELIGVGVSQREISRLTSISRTFIRKIQNGGHAEAEHYLRRETGEVKKLVEMSDYAGWFYDLTTSSGEFHCGVGRIHVHNSPRRGETFLTRKVTRGIARILAGKDEKIYLGNLNARRDWGYAPEYVEMMWMMLQQKNPEDYVVGTGENNSVGDFVREAFSLVGIDNWKKYVGIDPRYYRPTEVDDLRADISKAKKILKWEPQVKFKDLVKIMMKHDLEAHGLDELADKIVIKNKKALEAVEKRSKTERKVMRKLGKDGEA